MDLDGEAAHWRDGFARSYGVGFNDVTLAVGPDVDRCLDRSGALAMALDASTVWLSGRLRALPEGARRLVVGHELAHIVQLRRGGSDPEGALEVEAWRAAATAVRGDVYRVRGGASRPLCARAIIAMGGALDASAELHYKTFQAERIDKAGAIQVDATEIVPKISLDDLLAALIASFPKAQDKSFVVCAHGNRDGMMMPAVTGSRFVANTATLQFLMQPDVTSLDPTGPKGVVPLTTQQVADLVDKMEQVRKLKIVNVEFRGCAIGLNYTNLEALREFLGCTTVSAFDIKSSWARVIPNIVTAKQFDHWQKQNPKAEVARYAPGRCGITVDWAAERVVFLAETKEAVPFWLKEHFFRMPAFSTSPAYEAWMAHFAMHGLHATPLILPMDPGYATHLKRVSMTSGGLVKM
jgi:hypothetical protein